jgi:hypothetical protein
MWFPFVWDGKGRGFMHGPSFSGLEAMMRRILRRASQNRSELTVLDTLVGLPPSACGEGDIDRVKGSPSAY